MVTSGTSVLETAQLLRSQGLVVDQAVVLLNREQGGTENLAKHGITLHSLCGVSEMMDVLKKHNRVTEAIHNDVLLFVQNNRAALKVPLD